MRAIPIFLNSNGDAGRPLVRAETSANGARSEAWLQELLYTHPELLPVEAFDESYSPAIPIGREVATGRGPIDNLYVSPDGGITVVETKLWKNPEKHRTVVAQFIDYAKELAAWDYDRLCEAVSLGLVEMQLYQLEGRKEWPLIVAPEVVGRTVEKTRGIVRIEYCKEKPTVRVMDDDGPGDGSMTLEVFLKKMPRDLRVTFREAVQGWSEVGTIQFTDKMMFFEADIAGGQRIVRCRTYQISVITREAFEAWRAETAVYGDYLCALDGAPIVAAVARLDKKWIKYDRLSAADLKTLLTAARDLVRRVSSL